MANWRGDAVEIIKQAEAMTANNIADGAVVGTTATAIVTIPFAAGEIEAGDIVTVKALWESDNGANDDDMNIFVGATTVSTNTVLNAGTPTGKSYHSETEIYFLSNTSCIAQLKSLGNLYDAGTNEPTTIAANLNLANGFDIGIGCQLGDASSTVTLHGYVFSIIKKRV